MIVSRVVQYTAAECARLDGFVVNALRDLHLRKGSVPADLLELLAPVHDLAKEFRSSVLVEPGSGTLFDGFGSAAGPLGATERLTTHEAARITGTSESYLRRLAREGVVTATRSGSRGEWLLDGGSLAAWVAGRSNLRKAA